MNRRRLSKLLLAAVAAGALGACDPLTRDQGRESLWQAEVDVVALALHAQMAAQGRAEAFDSLRAHRDAVEARLGNGAPTPVPAGITRAWSEVRQGADQILSHQQAVLGAVDAELAFTAELPALLVRLDEIGRSLADGHEPRSIEQVRLLGQSQQLLQRMAGHAARIRAGDADAISAADRFNRDGTVLARILGGLQDGDAELGMEAITQAEASMALAQVRQSYIAIQPRVDALLASAPALLETHEAADSLPAAVESLRSALQQGREPR